MSTSKNIFVIPVACILLASLACSGVTISLYDTPVPPAPTRAIPSMPPPAAVKPLPATAVPEPTKPAQPIPGLEGYWQDGLKVFTIAWQDDKYEVTALEVVGETNPAILSQSWDGSALTWTYKSRPEADPNTFTTHTVQGDKLAVQWTNEQAPAGAQVWLRRASGPSAVHEPLPFYDDFDDPASGWLVMDDEYGILKYENGAYSVRSIQKEESNGSYAYHYFGDATIAADAVATFGPSDNDYGFLVGCNIQGQDDGYWFEVDMSGYYYMGVTTNGGDDYKSLFSGDDYRATNAVHTARGATNQFVVTCAHGQLQLEVNGKKLYQAADDTYADGDIYLGAISYGDLPAEFHFDHLSVTAP